VRQRVEARARRQERLTDENPIKVEAVVSEAAFRTLVGGPEVMSHQLRRLLELTKLPNIDLRVIPMAAGAYPAMGTPFSLLSFAGDYPDVGYIDLISKGVYVEEPDDVEPYKINFAGLQEVALTPRRTRALITELAGSFPLTEEIKVSATDLTHAVWRKGSRSRSRSRSRSNGTGGECVEVAFVPAATALRNSKNPAGGVLVLPPAAWNSFRTALKDG
jgi:hypothetical protein